MNRRVWIILGASLGFTIMVSSVSSIVRMVFATGLDGSILEFWKTYRQFFFGTLLSATFFMIFIPTVIASLYATRRWS